MSRSIRELTWQTLSGVPCEDCGEEYDLTRFEDAQVPDSDYAINYSCPACNSEYVISASQQGDWLTVTIHTPDLVPVNQLDTPTTSIQLREHSVRPIIERAYELVDVTDILLSNSKRVLDLRDEFPRLWNQSGAVKIEELLQDTPLDDLRLDVSDLREWSVVRREVHNYLATAYTFDQILETIKPAVEWNGDVEEQFRRYKHESRPILGLRHYCQHESLLPLEFRVQETDSQIETDIVADLDELRVMDSQVSESRPDGYREGSDHHYSGLESPLNVSTEIGEHCGLASELAISLLEHVLESNQESIEDYEEIRDQSPLLKDYDFKSRPDEWEE